MSLRKQAEHGHAVGRANKYVDATLFDRVPQMVQYINYVYQELGTPHQKEAASPTSPKSALTAIN